MPARGGAAFNIVGTMGTEVKPPSETVGNGLCAVPLRGKYNPCGQPEPPTGMSFRGSECESRNLPELLVSSCGGSYFNVVDSSTPLRYGRNDTMGDVPGFYWERFRPFRCH